MAIRARVARVAALGAVVTAAACATPGPRPLAFGQEECTRCHMTLADPRHAGQLVTVRGRVLPFDDVGCMAAFLAAGEIDPDQVHSLWFHDFAQPDSLLPATGMGFLSQDSIRTPMDHGVLALRPGGAADSLVRRTGGQLLSWDEVLARFRTARAR